MSERIGLIAGNGQFPVLFAKSALSCGREVVAIAVREETTPELEKYVHKTYWIGVGELKEFFRILKKEELKKVVMAGQIRPAHIFDENISMDRDLKRFLKKVKDKRAGSLLGEIAAILRKMGIKKTNIRLSKGEIDQTIEKFSQAKKIPIHEGILKIAAGRLVLSAIISDVIDSKFIIKKMSYSAPTPIFSKQR